MRDPAHPQTVNVRKGTIPLLAVTATQWYEKSTLPSRDKDGNSASSSTHTRYGMDMSAYGWHLYVHYLVKEALIPLFAASTAVFAFVDAPQVFCQLRLV